LSEEEVEGGLENEEKVGGMWQKIVDQLSHFLSHALRPAPLLAHDDLDHPRDEEEAVEEEDVALEAEVRGRGDGGDGRGRSECAQQR
jgi:hypothetical protein